MVIGLNNWSHDWYAVTLRPRNTFSSIQFNFIKCFFLFSYNMSLFVNLLHNVGANDFRNIFTNSIQNAE